MQERRSPIGSFYDEVVLPALFARLPQVFPEFGWRQDSRGWVATSEEFTHARFGVRADRVVAHAAPGFLIHGADPMLWTAYVNSGTVPKGADFARVVRELAERASIDTARIDRPQPPDRRADLLESFFELARGELTSSRGDKARLYLEQRGFPPETLIDLGLGVVPPAETIRQALVQAGYRDPEIDAAGLLDGRWPGRLCGAWANEWGRIATFWARAVDEGTKPDKRYLYLRGGSWSKLPPYGFRRYTRELVLVEGFLDYHQLAAHGVENVAALGSTRSSVHVFEQLSRLGVETVVLCLDTDGPGRAGTARAVENAARAQRAPAIYIADAGAAKDPDELVREHGVDAWRELIDDRECGIVWRAKEIVKDVSSQSSLPQRRRALRQAGVWLKTLPPRLALEQEDAVKAAAERCGYSPEAARRAFQEKFFRYVTNGAELSYGVEPARRVEAGVEI